jgi:hypothetical protein
VEIAGSFETLLTTYKTAWCYNLEDPNQYFYCCKNYIVPGHLYSCLPQHVVCVCLCVKEGLRKKGKVNPVQAVKAYRGNRGIAPLIICLGTTWRCSGPFTPGKNPSTHCIGGWVGPKATLDVLETLKVSCIVTCFQNFLFYNFNHFTNICHMF